MLTITTNTKETPRTCPKKRTANRRKTQRLVLRTGLKFFQEDLTSSRDENTASRTTHHESSETSSKTKEPVTVEKLARRTDSYSGVKCSLPMIVLDSDDSSSSLDSCNGLHIRRMIPILPTRKKSSRKGQKGFQTCHLDPGYPKFAEEPSKFRVPVHFKTPGYRAQENLSPLLKNFKPKSKHSSNKDLMHASWEVSAQEKEVLSYFGDIGLKWMPKAEKKEQFFAHSRLRVFQRNK